MEEKRIMSKHLVGKYEVVGVLPGEVYFRGETVDLRSVTLEKADEIVKAGFPYLKADARALVNRNETNKAAEDKK